MKKKGTEERIEFDPEEFSFKRTLEEAHQMERESNINLEISKFTIEQFDNNINIRKFYMFLIKQDMKLNLSKKLQKIYGDAYQENSLNDYELKKANNIKTNSTLDVKALKDLVCIIYLIYKQQHNHKKTTKEKIKTIKRILNMFYKDNDYYKLIFWKRIDNDYIIWRYNTNPKDHLSFYCIRPCEFLWGIHSVYRLKLYNNKLFKDFIISIINSEDISILESSKICNTTGLQ